MFFKLKQKYKPSELVKLLDEVDKKLDEPEAPAASAEPVVKDSTVLQSYNGSVESMAITQQYSIDTSKFIEGKNYTIVVGTMGYYESSYKTFGVMSAAMEDSACFNITNYSPTSSYESEYITIGYVTDPGGYECPVTAKITFNPGTSYQNLTVNYSCGYDAFNVQGSSGVYFSPYTLIEY